MKICVCGAAGGIGQPLSLLLKQQLPPGSTLSLYDVINTPGVGVDLSHINTKVKVESFLGDTKNPQNPEVDKALKDADVVVIPAGVPRKPGMTRDDLFKVNAGIVKGLIEAIAKNCPKAVVAIITNPVNSTVPVAVEVLKKHGVYDARKLVGVSILDVVRAQTFISELKGVDPASVKVDVVGGHSPETMIPVLSQVKGVTFTEEEAKKLTVDVKEAGTAVVNAKDGAGSATLSMAFAGARFTLAIVSALQGKSGVQECAFVDVESLGLEVRYCGVPVELGRDGISTIHPLPKFNAYEQQQWQEAVPVLKKNIDTGFAFAHGQ